MAESSYGTCALAIFVSVLALWGIHIPMGDPTLVDVFWGLGFVLQAFLCIPYARYSIHSLLLTAIVGVWGVRLSRFLFSRWRKNGPEKRYQKLLNKLGGNPIFTSLYAIFLSQGLALWIVGLPIQQAAAVRAGLSIRKLLGAVIAIAGLLTESLADWQKTKFQARNGTKKVMDEGLWRYSRHPNFFGNCLFWWGIYFFTASSFISWTIISPLFMTFTLLCVTGVPAVEADRKSDPEYQAYMRRTHVFVPWFPKTQTSSRRRERLDDNAGNEGSEQTDTREEEEIEDSDSQTQQDTQREGGDRDRSQERNLRRRQDDSERRRDDSDRSERRQEESDRSERRRDESDRSERSERRRDESDRSERTKESRDRNESGSSSRREGKTESSSEPRKERARKEIGAGGQ